VTVAVATDVVVGVAVKGVANRHSGRCRRGLLIRGCCGERGGRGGSQVGVMIGVAVGAAVGVAVGVAV
jgi:hypothetical protein